MTRIALVLGGRASLGSYVAGAVTELVRALERNRRGGVSIDVITGASAGAVTAAVAARALVVNPALLPWLERVWVDALDVRHLLNPDRPDTAATFDASVVEELASSLIVTPAAGDDERSSVAGDPVRLGITLSALDGIPYDFRYGFLSSPQRSYGSRVYRDWIEFELESGIEANDPAWIRLRDAALASAAFPFAFPPRSLERDRSEYPGAHLAPGATVRMWYADGGLSAGEPVGLAKRLVERWPDHRDTDWRYILVDPHMEAERCEASAERDPPTTAGRLAVRLADALIGQGVARDWMQANKVNARLEILQALVERLPELGDRLYDPASLDLGRSIGDLAERVAELKVAVAREPAPKSGDPVLVYLDQNLARIRSDPRYLPVLAKVDAGAARTRVAKLIFVLEAAAGLRDKDVMPLYLLAPESPGELAGDFLGSFAGFLSSDWRAHDLRSGRRDARRLLERQFADILDFEPGPDEAYELPTVDASWETVPPESRARLERFVRGEADRLLDQLQPGPIASVLAWLWKPWVRAWASRRILDGLRRMA